MILHREDFGTPSGIPLVLVHGLMGQGRNLAGIARAMAKTRHVITVDLRNHGQSPWSDDNAYADLADDLRETLAEFSRVDVMGHSMGGKVAMQIALAQPDWVRKLMVVDIAPVAYTHSHAPEIDILLDVDLAAYSRRGEVDAVLQPLIPDNGMRAFFLHGLDTRPNLRWVNNLVALRANMDAITGWPETAGQFDGDALFVRGGNSTYVADDGIARINALFPNAQHHTQLGAGHWLHVEKPAEFLATMRDYFS